MNSMEISEILEYLPHRYPFLLIDKVINVESGKSITALKNVTINEPFFTGHFPNYPIMPGVLILEALAQTAGILAYKTANTPPDSGYLVFYAGIDSARFKRVVRPGDQLILQVNLSKVRRELWKFSATASVDNQLACEAELLLARKELESKETENTNLPNQTAEN